MLKALELIGFKSFADKTRLEFPPGITVVVGPNGSGKSNIVDAIKWVLGEQSVKSLRGKEMADCIFNGSATRRPLNSAETTLTFDNSTRILALDTPEVHITRRVYRSGEGEYLINRQPCRLRDIRDLFAGTGVATEAYSVIEQGKVDVLLQASPRDRRLIFEEAAGISRFKAKKVETQRRLERVEQNLLRLSDIVDEVESRVKTVRLQAAKARRYKEYADRLQQLRTQVGLVDWRKLSEKLASLDAELETAAQEIATFSRQAEALEARLEGSEMDIAEIDRAIRASEAQFAHNRERIASHEAAIEHERRRMRDFDDEAARYRRQSAALSIRVGDVQQQLQETSVSLVALEAAERETAHRLAQEERVLSKLTAERDETVARNEQRRVGHLEALKFAALLGKKISGLEAQVTSTKRAHEIGRRRQIELRSARETLVAELTPLAVELDRLARLAQEQSTALHRLRDELTAERGTYAAGQQELSILRERHSGAAERRAILDELEQRLEGISAGVKHVLERSRGADPGPFGHVRGMVADLLHVSMETAPLVEIALGEAAQHLVVDNGRELLLYLQNGQNPFAGRVGFVRLDVPADTTADVDLTGQLGVLGRADRFVETAPEHVALAKRLLGRTWIVEKLSHALALADRYPRGLSFVTLEGELLAADGTIVAGPRNSSIGLISRRSELRVLVRQVAELTEEIQLRQVRQTELEDRIAALEQSEQQLSTDHEELSEQLSKHRLRTAGAEQRLAEIESQDSLVERELTSASAEHQRVTRLLADTRAELARIETEITELETRIAQDAAQAAQLDESRQRQSREAGSVRIELTKHTQQLEHLRMQRHQLDRDQQERARTVSDSRAQLAACEAKSQEATRSILAAESQLAELYLRKERLALETTRRIEQRQTLHSDKAQVAGDVQRLRGKVRKLETRLHARQLAATEVRHERTTLAERLREDYGIEIAQLQAEPAPAELEQRSEVEREIADLRGKLNSIGGVNLDALDELEQLEGRFATLSAQYQDLVSAKASLEQIISRINADSRRLFAETLEVVREHFQSLFRKLFGGGQADIVLEPDVDILDSGIEIMARPPGKEPRNISLLSGGERTLTCVALLLAIFRSRPSPFCVLDEVDAALDEANIERFIAVLSEFLAWTQFIVITHSKKTMTCAGTLYGITMQESGVSKRVSVRFEDVSETGEISALAQARGDGDSAGQAPADETQAA